MSSKREATASDETLLRALKALDEKVGVALEAPLVALQEAESTIDERILYEKRIGLASRLQNITITRRVLRLFLTHRYIPPTASDFARFQLRIDGFSFHPGREGYKLDLCNYLAKILVEGDSRVSLNGYEWQAKDNPAGASAQSVLITVPCDKPFTTRISLTLLDPGSGSRKVSPALRNILPHIGSVATEEEVFVAVLHYISAMHLFSENRLHFRCDDSLRILLDCDSAPVHKLRLLLSKYLSDPEPIEIEYTFRQSTAVIPDINELLASNPRQSVQSLVEKMGGKVVDIEVMVRDPTNNQYLAEVNCIADTEFTERTKQVMVTNKLTYLARELAEDFFLISELSDLANGKRPRNSDDYTLPVVPLVMDLIGQTRAESTAWTQPIRSSNSAIHNLGRYMNVGQNYLFEPNAPWMDITSRQMFGLAPGSEALLSEANERRREHTENIMRSLTAEPVKPEPPTTPAPVTSPTAPVQSTTVNQTALPKTVDAQPPASFDLRSVPELPADLPDDVPLDLDQLDDFDIM